MLEALQRIPYRSLSAGNALAASIIASQAILVILE